MVKDDELSFGHFLDWHKRQQEREDLINDFEAPRDSIPARGSIATRWTIKTMSPGAKALIDIFSLLDPDSIQDEVVVQSLDNIDPWTLLKDFPRTYKEMIPARKELTDRPFVKFDRGEKHEWRIHRSVQGVFRFYMDQQRMQEVFTSTIALVHNFWEPEYYKGRSHSVARWRKYNQLHNHLISISNIYCGLFRKGSLSPSVQLSRLLFQCAWVLKEQGLFTRADELLELGREICEKCPATDETSRILADIWHTMGSIAMEVNDPECAMKNTEKVLRYWQDGAKKSGIEDRNLAVGYLQHAGALLIWGEYAKSEEELKKGLAIMESVVGDDKERMSSWVLDLGYAYLLQGKLDDAEAILNEGLAERVKKFGHNDTYSYKSGAYHHALGNVYSSRSTPEALKEAEHLHTHALWQYEATLGTNHHRTADMYHIIAGYRRLESKWPKAETLLRDTLRIWNHNPNYYKPEIARSKFVLSLVIAEQGSRDDEAIILRNEACLGRRQHPWANEKEDIDLCEADFDRLVVYSSR